MGFHRNVSDLSIVSVIAVAIGLAAWSVGAKQASAVSGDNAASFMASSAAQPGMTGHPTVFQVPMLPPSTRGGMMGPQPNSFAELLPDPNPTAGTAPGFELPVLSPLATGPFVNFESPPVSPIAVSGNGNRVVVANTPNNSVMVLDSTNGQLTLLGEIPVGLEPVSVAFQPRASDNLVWVACHVSDSVNIIDLTAQKVVSVIEVGDEPASIVFNRNGTFAFVVVQGSPHWVPGDTTPVVQEGNLVTIDTVARQIVSTTFLDCHTPRYAYYDEATDQIVVAAALGGNHHTVVGDIVTLMFTEPVPTNPAPIHQPPANVTSVDCGVDCNCTCYMIPHLWVVQRFSATQPLFDAAPELAPWPDPHADPEFPPSPYVHRVVKDMSVTTGNAWRDIVDTLSDDNGDPDPQMVGLMNAEFGISNADEIIATIIEDAKPVQSRNLIVLDASNPSAPAGLPILNVVGGIGTTIGGLAKSPLNGKTFVTNANARLTIRGEEALKGHVVDHRVTMLTGPSVDPVALQVKDLHADIPGFNNVADENMPAKLLSLAGPTSVAFNAEPARHRAYVAAFNVDRIGVLDGTTARVLARFDVGAGPRGLTIDPPHNRLYVFNRDDLSVQSIDAATDALQLIDTLSLFNPEPAVIRAGRRFMNDAKLANNAATACATCHPSGTSDFLDWDLGNFDGELEVVPDNLIGVNHPIKGPMVTLTLQGMKDHNNFHWRGDRQRLQDFNGAFENLLGGPQLSPPEIDAFAAFLETLVFPPNPFLTRNNTYKEPRAIDAIANYLGLCNGCHMITHDGAMTAPDVESDLGGNFQGPPIFAQIQEVTQLRGIYKKFQNDDYLGFGLIHDGREESEEHGHPLATFLVNFFAITDPEVQQDMIAFINAFPTNVMSVVGWQVMVADPGDTVQTGKVTQMINQYLKVPSHCDVIAQGRIAGQHQGYFLTGTTPEPTFRTELDTLVTLSDLYNLVSAGDPLVFMAVPPDSGCRMAIDKDSDGLPNGVDPSPEVSNFGDSDLDGDVDLGDFGALFGCFTGPAGQLGAGCAIFDGDCDGNVDLIDLRMVQNVFTVP